MAKIHIEKSAETIKKEKIKAKFETLKYKKNVTNDELKDLLLILLEKIDNK